MGRQMYPPEDSDDTKVHVMALTGHLKNKRQHGSVEHMELCLAMGSPPWVRILLLTGSRIKVK